jgi:hypothetical protein
MAEFSNYDAPWTGIIGTDSLSVLETIAGKAVVGATRQRLQEPIQIHGETVRLDPLCADWDVLIEIKHTLQQLPGISIQ